MMLIMKYPIIQFLLWVLLVLVCRIRRREKICVKCLILISGTNNARLAAMLRQLAVYHGKDMNNLFMVRLAQGLTHLGKGTMTLNPYHSDRMLLCRVSLAGLLTVLVSFFDVKQSNLLGVYLVFNAYFLFSYRR
jgi:hypothetical protein